MKSYSRASENLEVELAESVAGYLFATIFEEPKPE
jgi:hypothetical protein